MAKKQLTPEQYKAKLEKRTEKRKKFTGLFLKTVAICVAIVIVYSTSIVAHTRIGLSTIVKNTGTSVNSSNQSSGNNGSNWNEGSDETPAIPEEDPTTPSGDQGGEAATVMTSKTMQFDLFVKAFSGVKTNAKSVTILKKNAYNYNNHVEAGMLSSLGSTLMSSFLKEEGDYYVITVVVKGAVNPNAGEKVGAVASILTKQSIQDPIKDVPLINSIEPKCDYKDTTAEAKIEKSTGNLVEYYFDLPMILFMDSYEIGLGFEEWWTVAY